MRYDLIAVGDVMFDILVPAVRPGERLHAPIVRRAGGSAVNAAIAAAETGASAAVVGRVGADAIAEWIERELRAAGVEPLLTVDPVAPTGTVIAMGDGDDTAVAADRGANARIEPQHLPRDLDATAVFVSAYLPENTVAGALARARNAIVGGRVLRADVVVANGAEAIALTGMPDAAAAARALASGRRAACVTLAERGCIAAAGDEVVTVAPSVLLDTTPLGAGDRFAAGFLLALARNASLEEAASAACTLATQTRGA